MVRGSLDDADRLRSQIARSLMVLTQRDMAGNREGNPDCILEDRQDHCNNPSYSECRNQEDSRHCIPGDNWDLHSNNRN